jgi:uncharacterized protein YqgC (DUF456 family)
MVPDIPEMLSLVGSVLTYLISTGNSPTILLPLLRVHIDEYVRCYSAPGALRAGLSYYRTLFEDVDQTGGSQD